MFRFASTSDLDALVSARPIDPVAMIDADRFRRELVLDQYRFEWSWLAEIDGRLAARALWWGQPDSTHPLALDCVWVAPQIIDKAALASDLIRTAHRSFREAGLETLPDLGLIVPTDWRTDPEAVAAVDWRVAAAGAAGLTERIDRLRFEWTPESGLSTRSTRLTFRPSGDDDFLDIFAATTTGSLDIRTVRMLAEVGSAGQAADDLAFYLSLPGRRDDWRIAYDGSGDRVGFIIPSRTVYGASVSYLGVLPPHRGRHYVDDLLAEITHVHAAAGADRITGTTDLTNAPMAAAFRRAGYRVTEARVIIGPPAGAEELETLTE